MKNKRNVLVIGDLHLPYVDKKALSMAKRLYKDKKITDVVFIGDILDNHYLSYHENAPDGLGNSLEMKKADRELKKWSKAFPDAVVTLGNHDNLVNRKAFSSGLSNKWIKSIGDVYNLSWTFLDHYKIGDVLFYHGIGESSYSKACSTGLTTVAGHLHSKLGITRIASGDHKKPTYAINTGCLIDQDAYTFDYAKFGKPVAKGFIVIEDVLGDTSYHIYDLK